ncbi:MAG: threonylcarbamoyl-AMP synthase [Candidatus Nomurabacteria bacterium]|nr:MAG: threonylcarbamoyl-AMP synthase [Candidatus Nomurabacteria bacterium]
MRRLLIHDPEALSTAVRALKNGQLIIYPTDTAYAIGADATNAAAVRAVQQVKQRSEAKPLPLIAADSAQVAQVAILHPDEELLAKKHWPGPLSLLLDRKGGLPEEVTLGLPKVAIRVPHMPFARELALRLGHPVVATSANMAGMGPKYDPDEVLHELVNNNHSPVVLIDGGVLAEVPPSTIAECHNGEVKIHRQGPIVIPGATI